MADFQSTANMSKAHRSFAESEAIDCRVWWQLRKENCRMDYKLTDEGILIVSGNSWLCRKPAPDAVPVEVDEYDGTVTEWSEYMSQFKDLVFHKVVIEPGITCLDELCFEGCKNLREIILPETLFSVYADFAKDTPLEYLDEGGLLYLGTAENPHHILMGCTPGFNESALTIAEGTVKIAHKAFYGKRCIREVILPSTLEYMGRECFAGTSIKNFYIPEGPLADDEWILSFDSAEFELSLESVSFPIEMYESYLDNQDWYDNLHCTLIYRNHEGTVEKVVAAKP